MLVSVGIWLVLMAIWTYLVRGSSWSFALVLKISVFCLHLILATRFIRGKVNAVTGPLSLSGTYTLLRGLALRCEMFTLLGGRETYFLDDSLTLRGPWWTFRSLCDTHE